MNNGLDEAFTRLLGTAPSPSQREQLYRVRDALGLADNDALWLVLMALESYRGHFERIPQEIKRSTGAAVTAIRSASAQGPAARPSAVHSPWMWVAAALAGSLIFVCGWIWGFSTGLQDGRAAAASPSPTAAKN